MHLHQEVAHRSSEPSPTTKLEPAQMSAPVSRTKHGVGILFDFFVGDCVDAGYLIALALSLDRVDWWREGKGRCLQDRLPR
jgi:hypothetical protein